MNTIEISTTSYEFVHGRKPRGRGYWVFFFDGQTHVDDGFYSRPAQLYSAALTDALTYARAKGHHKVTVGA